MENERAYKASSVIISSHDHGHIVNEEEHARVSARSPEIMRLQWENFTTDVKRSRFKPR